MNVYPSQYQPAELTAHVISLLERRRGAFEVWSEENEATLEEEARRALAEAGQQFREIADDSAWWQRATELVMSVGLPRYLKAAKEQYALEKRGYDVWRKGDALSRVAFALGGLVVGFVVLRTALPDWLEPIPLAFFIGGPLLPDAQVWFAKRKYSKQLATLVDDMRQEELDRRAYQPWGVDENVGQTADPAQAQKREKV